MQSRLITSAKASVLLAIAGIITDVLFRETQTSIPATPAEQGRAEGEPAGRWSSISPESSLQSLRCAR